jgi:hypothetical protein
LAYMDKLHTRLIAQAHWCTCAFAAHRLNWA